MGEEYTRRISILGNIPALGPVSLFDDLLDPLKWTESGTGGDTIFELDPSFSFSGKNSLHLKTRTAGAAQNDTITASRLVHIPPSKKVIASSVFYIPSKTAVLFMSFEFIYYDGTNHHTANILYYPGTPNWRYADADAGYTAIPDSGNQLLITAWHRLTFGIDFNNDLYGLVKINGRTFNLAAIPIYSDTGPPDEHLKVSVNIIAAGAAPAEAWLDTILAVED